MYGLFDIIHIFSILHVSLDNLAQEKPTRQSSLYADYYASNAVDGRKGKNVSQCTHTRTTSDPWWRVDLEQVHPVSEVYILNRGDCCGDRLHGAEIRVGKCT